MTCTVYVQTTSKHRYIPCTYSNVSSTAYMVSMGAGSQIPTKPGLVPQTAYPNKQREKKKFSIQMRTSFQTPGGTNSPASRFRGGTFVRPTERAIIVVQKPTEPEHTLHKNSGISRPAVTPDAPIAADRVESSDVQRFLALPRGLQAVQATEWALFFFALGRRLPRESVSRSIC